MNIKRTPINITEITIRYVSIDANKIIDEILLNHEMMPSCKQLETLIARLNIIPEFNNANFNLCCNSVPVYIEQGSIYLDMPSSIYSLSKLFIDIAQTTDVFEIANMSMAISKTLKNCLKEFNSSIN